MSCEMEKPLRKNSVEKERCEICQMHPASIEIKLQDDGKQRLIKICKDCAEFKGYLKKDDETNLAAFFKKASLNILGPEDSENIKNFDELECSECGLTFNEFQNSGLLGCANCYTVFGEELNTLLRRIHGSSKHVGSRPHPMRVIAKKPDLTALKRELHEAIEHENFERAADYRDLIRDLEREEFRKT